jgi:hypothetical protein
MPGGPRRRDIVAFEGPKKQKNGSGRQSPTLVLWSMRSSTQLNRTNVKPLSRPRRSCFARADRSGWKWSGKLIGLSAHGEQSGACGYYTNSLGHQVPRPCGDWRTNQGERPARATALCGDGTYSYSERAYAPGTCSYHGGAVKYLIGMPNSHRQSDLPIEHLVFGAPLSSATPRRLASQIAFGVSFSQ